MLPYALAVTVGLSSSVLFVTAFFFRDIHRQDDFFWSGVGLFYALVLWFCATSITGAVLLGQLAVVALLTAYFWQVIKLRKAIANPEQQNNLDSFSVVNFFKNLVKRSQVATVEKEKTQNEPLTSATKQTPQKPTPPKTATPQVTTENPLVEKAVSSENQTKIADNLADRASQQDSSPKPTSTSTTTQSNEIANAEDTTSDASEISVETTVKEVTTEQEIQPSITEGKKLETTEIAVETFTVVEEETNWDDEVEDIPASSVTIIQETSTPSEPESQSSTVDNSSQEDKPHTRSEPSANPESSD